MRVIWIRRLAAAAVWCLLILSFLFSARASVFASKAYNTLAAKAYTPDEASLRENVAETARQFAVEWATWTGDQQEYARRLAAFLADPAQAALPQGVQRAAAAAVTSLQDGGSGLWRATVLLHVERLVKSTSADASNVPPALWAAGDPSQPAPPPGQQKEIGVWRPGVLAVEVPVRVKNGRAAVAGLPLLVTPPPGAGSAAAPTDGFNDTADGNLTAFVQQFLDLYYSGGNIQNFVAAGSGLRPLGGWKVSDVSQVRTDNKDKPTRALVECDVAAPGAAGTHQRLMLDLTSAGGHFLISRLAAMAAP